MNKYDNYKECLQKEIDDIMLYKIKNIKALEYLHCLFDMVNHLKEQSKIYDEMISKNEIENLEKQPDQLKDVHNHQWKDKVPDSFIDERMYGMIEHFRMYKEYKTMYKKTKNEHDKQLMLEELKHLIEQHQLMVKEVMSCLDCQEEKTFIKDFLQQIYKSIN